MKHGRISVILPTYNESGNIVPLVRTILWLCNKHKIPVEIIVVDDDSPDGTATKASKSFRKQRRVKIFRKTTNRGLASSIYYGVNKSRGKYIVVMDTDFNHDPHIIPKMYHLIATHDLVIGSRYVKGGGMENRLRQWLSYFFNLYLRLLLRHGVHDNLSGYFIIKRSILMKLPLKKILRGFGEYFISLVYITRKKNLDIVETPVFYKNRVYGVSKSRFVSMFITYTITALQIKIKS